MKGTNVCWLMKWRENFTHGETTEIGLSSIVMIQLHDRDVDIIIIEAVG